MDDFESKLRADILDGTRRLIRHRLEKRNSMDQDVRKVPYAGRVYDECEVIAAVDSTLDFWLTLGPQGEEFERRLAQFLKVRHSLLVNSGSSANLVAVAALTSHRLGSRRLRPGDEVITTAAGFPTTVAPIIQHRAVPVFVDTDPTTGNIKVDQLEDALTQGKTKAVMVAHTLGNPFNVRQVKQFCDDNNLWLIEDNCDALGSQYDGRWTGNFGAFSTQSFYPPHHLTMGEGGAVNVSTQAPSILKVVAESFRDWGRDCWCASGMDDTCNKRFGWQLGQLPKGYDHKYIYSHLGYNLKPTDPQAAIGLAQLDKLPDFIDARVRNWNFLRESLAGLDEYFDFMLPTHAAGWSKDGFAWRAGLPRVQPSWFGFMMRRKRTAPFSRAEFVRALDEARIGNRMMFGGNLVRQPAFLTLKKQYETRDGHFEFPPFRVVSDLTGADSLMNEAVFLGVFPGLSRSQLEYMTVTIEHFVRSKTETIRRGAA